jgi:YVTN family beta-propeller protein
VEKFDDRAKVVASVSLEKDVKAAHDDRVFEFSTTPVVQIPVHNGPISGIIASPDGSRLMVTNYGRDSVSVIDTDTCKVVETVPDVKEPFAIAAGSRDGDRAYVSTGSPAYDSIDVIDVSTNTVVASHPLALSVSDLAVSPDGKYVYASRNGARGADVAVLDTATGQVRVIDIATAPGTTTECVRVSSDGARVYVGANGPSGGQLVVIETAARSDQASGSSGKGRSSWRRKKPKTSARSSASKAKGGQTSLGVVFTVEIGSPVRDVALSPNGDVAYVASCDPDFGALIDVIDTRTNKITRTRKVAEISGLLTGLTLSADGDRAYLVSDDSLTVLCTLTHDVIGTVRAAKQPSCVVESPDGQYLYIADYSGAVTVAPVTSAMVAAIECAEHDSDGSDGGGRAEWTVPELLPREAALV